MTFLKPILIAVILILTVLIIVKANRFATSDQPEGRQKQEKQPPAPPKAEPPMQTPTEFFIVYVGRRVPVTHYPFTIGSRNDNDLIITDSTVSRQHAELFRKNGQVCLRDLGSLNGTIVNKVPRSETPIVGGERVQLGTTILQIERARDDVSDDTQFIRR
ncbi:MAG TPA: FHA domain-containing protein [Candidatus Butyricicoccus stercorigallinarum]|nr:FHA domain-containing protein [Candidatus Butyricicoccus stercorigallinarum]